MLSGLVARMTFEPVGLMASTLLSHRLIAMAAAILVFFWFGRSVLAGVVAGFVVLASLLTFGGGFAI